MNLAVAAAELVLLELMVQVVTAALEAQDQHLPLAVLLLLTQVVAVVELRQVVQVEPVDQVAVVQVVVQAPMELLELQTQAAVAVEVLP
jgi:hypothetical protein